MTDHNELRALALAATPGPWEYSTAGLGATDGSLILTEHFVRRPGDDVAIAAEIINPDDCKTSEDNAAYIAAANPATVLALLDELDAANTSRREAQARVAELTEQAQKLGARVERDELDAARYRCLRSAELCGVPGIVVYEPDTGEMHVVTGVDADAAIDAAMSMEGGAA